MSQPLKERGNVKTKFNKKWAAIPLATVFVAGAVQAQSSVTISGLLDVGVYRDTNKAWNVGSIQPSYLAFSGKEDLGGGLSATFRLSTRFELDTGTTELTGKPFWHDESTLGLKGNFGSIQMGRRFDAIYRYTYQFDPWIYYDRLASPAWDLWGYNYPSDPHANSGGPDYGRLNNGIFYDSPTFQGVTLHLSGSPETAPGDNNKPLAGSLTYNGESMAAMVGHGRNSAGSTDYFLGLKVMFADFDVMGVYDQSEAGSSKAKTFTAGASYRLGATTLRAGWGQVDVNGVKAEKIVSGSVLYSLSKRTSLYVDLARKDFVDSSANLYGVGLAHSF